MQLVLIGLMDFLQAELGEGAGEVRKRRLIGDVFRRVGEAGIQVAKEVQHKLGLRDRMANIP